MGYTSVWKVLDEMIADFRRRGVVIPPGIVSNMTTAKATIKLVQKNPECAEELRKVDQYLGNVQICLFSEGERKFGQKYTAKWLHRIDEASRKVSDEEKEKERFVLGPSREQTWIRIALSAELPLQEVKKVAREHGLTCTEQTDNALLVHGDKKKLKDFVKKIATGYKTKTGKMH